MAHRAAVRRLLREAEEHANGVDRQGPPGEIVGFSIGYVQIVTSEGRMLIPERSPLWPIDIDELPDH